MILTPTYHVFEMYKVHQDAEKLALAIQTDVKKKSMTKTCRKLLHLLPELKMEQLILRYVM